MFLREPGICFQVVMAESESISRENVKQLVEKKSQLGTLNQRIGAGMKAHKKILKKFEKKKKKVSKFLDVVEPILRYYSELGMEPTQETAPRMLNV